MRHLRKAIAAAFLAPLILTAAQATAANGPPEPVQPQTFRFAPGEACVFPLGLVQSGGNVHMKEFVDRNGAPVRIITAGKGFLLTYTNLETGASVTIRTDGSVSTTTNNPDGTLTVSATGHNGLILFSSDIPAGPTTTQYIGRIVYNIDPATGIFTLVSTSGSQRDICAELAS